MHPTENTKTTKTTKSPEKGSPAAQGDTMTATEMTATGDGVPAASIAPDAVIQVAPTVSTDAVTATSVTNTTAAARHPTTHAIVNTAAVASKSPRKTQFFRLVVLIHLILHKTTEDTTNRRGITPQGVMITSAMKNVHKSKTFTRTSRNRLRT